MAFAAFVLLLLGPATALAGELQFDVEEDAAGVTVKVRGLDGEDAPPKRVVTSRSGMLFFFDAAKAKTARLRPAQRHRIAYAQVGQTGHRVALRLAQRERARGSLGTFVTTVPVDGGLDIRIMDRQGGEAVEEEAEEAEGVAEADAAPAEAGDTALAALEASLGGSEPTPTPPAPAPDPEPAPSELEDDAPEAVAAIAPEVDPEPPAETSSSSAGLRSMLAVALLFAFGGAAMWWLKRRKQIGTAPVLDIVSRVGIGPKQSVVLINAGGRQLLIGATERRIEVLTEIGAAPAAPTAELRVPSVLDTLSRPSGAGGARDPFAGPRAPIPPPTDPTAPAKIAAFKARLEQALGRELTGEHALVAESGNRWSPPDEHPIMHGEPESTPPHLRLLQNDARWTGEEGVA
jgi:flagellar biogenesis protein FliO